MNTSTYGFSQDHPRLRGENAVPLACGGSVGTTPACAGRT
jgi:hypothetical protein